MVVELSGPHVEQVFNRRKEATEALAQHAERVARACYDMARRFHCGGKLICFGNGRDAGLLTVALVGGDGGEIGRTPGLDHVLIARSTDPQVVKEVQVTTYHVLWELVHIFFEQPSVLDPAVFLG